jgi:tripartite-type tricarboxylate transporter receptor subunit TctC
VLNKPGAAGLVGTQYVVNSKPDGYTFLFAGAPAMVTHQFLHRNLSYDPEKSLIPVHGLFETPMLLVVRADAPYKTLAEFIDYAKRNPGKLNYYSTGLGSTPHLATELLSAEADIKMVHIPHLASAQALTALLAGDIDVMMDFSVSVKQYIDVGKLRALATTGAKRLANIPDIPTFSEQGYPGVVYTAWATIALPAGVPQPIVDRLADALDKTLRDPSIIEYLQDQGAVPMNGIAKEKLVEFLAGERVKLKSIFERARIQPE